jgi:ABC-type transport system involved in multi-copper enzyme maturation permease subunit
VAADWLVWRERLIGFAFVGAGVGLWLLGGRLTLAQEGVLWAGLVLALVLVAALGWLPLLGPVFVYDLVRTTRRGRYAVLRCVYAVALILFILALYRVQPALLSNPWVVGAGGLARFAETFSYTFLAVQFLAIVMLTPAYVAGAVAEEKDRKTLEFLLATDIRDREIVLGKMASRVANLALLVLTGLPILSLTQLWGGVDIGLLLYAFVATGVTLLSLAAVSMVASVYSRKSREAVVLAYLIVAGYVGLSVLVHLLTLFPSITALPLTWGKDPWTIDDLVKAITAGNGGLLCLGLRNDLLTGVTLQESLSARMSGYILFQLLVAVVGTGWAVLRLRPLALVEGAVKSRPATRRGWRLGWRPRVGRRALLWKEIWAEPGMTFNWFGKAVVLLIVLVSLVPALWIVGDFVYRHAEHGAWFWRDLAQNVNIWVRIVGTLVACLTLLGVAVRAASSVSGERDRQTMDSLLTAPVESDNILRAKWWGSILSVRWAWLWLCLVWAIGGATDGLEGSAVPWIVLAWAVYAGFLAVLGLWFSVTCRTTLRATVWTLLTAAALGVGHWYLWLLFCLPLQLQERTFGWVLRFQKYALTPPLALAAMAFRGDHLTEGVVWSADDDPVTGAICVVAGLLLWGTAGYVLWRSARRRFRVLAGRVPIPVPAGAPPWDAGQISDLPQPDDRQTPDVAKPRPRWRRRVLIASAAAVVIVLLPTGWGVYRGVMADRHLNEAIEEADRTDPGWRLTDIEAARAPVPDDRNSGPLILAIRGLIPRGAAWPTRELASKLDELPPQVRLSPDQWRGVTDDLEDVEEALGQVGPLADMPQGRYAIKWSRDFIGTLLPHMDAQWVAGQLLWHDLLLRAEEGDPDGALADCRRLLNVGRSIGDEPLVASQSVRMRAARSTVRALQRVLAQGEPSDAALADLQRRLAEEEAHPGLLIGAHGERAVLDGFVALVQAEKIPWQATVRWVDPPDRDEKDALEWLVFSLTPGADKESRAALLRHQAEFIEAARLPAEEQEAAFARLGAKQQAMPLLARRLAMHADKVSERFRQGRAELRCAVAALAAERFRRRHQRWPERLDELTPDFLEKLPADPFGGAALRYRRLADGVVIYSVGLDGRDDGGDVLGIPWLERTGKDLGFRLWDVSKRRQEPPKPAGMEVGGERR